MARSQGFVLLFPLAVVMAVESSAEPKFLAGPLRIQSAPGSGIRGCPHSS